MKTFFNLGLVTLLISQSLMAAKRTPEIYSATEEESARPTGEVPIFPVATTKPAPQKKASATKPAKSLAARMAKVERELQLLRSEVAQATEAKPSKSATTDSSSFDLVPTDQRELIIRRLKLVEQIIRVHGRAYDYRVNTTKDLEGTLRELESPKDEDVVLDET